jgi:hypothetical protein
MKNKRFNEILILMKLHIRQLQIQFAKVTIAGVLDSPVPVTGFIRISFTFPITVVLMKISTQRESRFSLQRKFLSRIPIPDNIELRVSIWTLLAMHM